MANVTVSLAERLLCELRHIAAEEGVPLSRFVARTLEERVETIRRFRWARERQLQLLQDGLVLGTNGHVRWSRDSLHER
jgi:hypothetical protein